MGKRLPEERSDGLSLIAILVLVSVVGIVAVILAMGLMGLAVHVRTLGGGTLFGAVRPAFPRLR
ncbi:MAG TPA: hypothetical protein VIA06_19590 [Candidatus Dormibacteraeota bacterium]|nr:hypothetical protein [Candidatus Dormibacteraeota bacterium]